MSALNIEKLPCPEVLNTSLAVSLPYFEITSSLQAVWGALSILQHMKFSSFQFKAQDASSHLCTYIAKAIAREKIEQISMKVTKPSRVFYLQVPLKEHFSTM